MKRRLASLMKRLSCNMISCAHIHLNTFISKSLPVYPTFRIFQPRELRCILSTLFHSFLCFSFPKKVCLVLFTVSPVKITHALRLRFQGRCPSLNDTLCLPYTHIAAKSTYLKEKTILSGMLFSQRRKRNFLFLF